MNSDDNYTLSPMMGQNKNEKNEQNQGDIFESLQSNLFLTNRKMKVEEEKIIENMRFVSKKQPLKNEEQITNQFMPKPNLNYGGSHKYNDTYEISFKLKEQLEHLEMIKNLVEEKFGKRTPGVNFFLDDSNEEEVKEVQNGHSQADQIERNARDLLKRNEGPFNATCLRDTWSKGQDFFFIDKGDYLKVIQITENGKYAVCEFEGKRGILHVNDIRVYGHSYDSITQD